MSYHFKVNNKSKQTFDVYGRYSDELLHTDVSIDFIKKLLIDLEYNNFLQNIIKIEYDFPFDYTFDYHRGDFKREHGAKFGSEILLDIIKSGNYVEQIDDTVNKILGKYGVKVTYKEENETDNN